jgi:hypothetical protein
VLHAHRALREFEEEFNRFPTRTALGNCREDVDGYPTSIARPSLWGTPMFTDRAGNEAINDAARDLPVVQVLELCGTTALRCCTTGTALQCALVAVA